MPHNSRVLVPLTHLHYLDALSVVVVNVGLLFFVVKQNEICYIGAVSSCIDAWFYSPLIVFIIVVVAVLKLYFLSLIIFLEVEFSLLLFQVVLLFFVVHFSKLICRVVVSVVLRRAQLRLRTVIRALPLLRPPVAVDPSSQVAPPVPSSSIQAHTANVVRSRLSLSSSGPSTSLHLEPDYSATASCKRNSARIAVGFCGGACFECCPCKLGCTFVASAADTLSARSSCFPSRIRRHPSYYSWRGGWCGVRTFTLDAWPALKKLLAPPVPPSCPLLLTLMVSAPSADWNAADRDTVLLASSRPWFTEASGMKIRAFLNDSELFLQLCGRPRARWGLFVMSWLGFAESDKVRRSHIVDDINEYDKFRE